MRLLARRSHSPAAAELQELGRCSGQHLAPQPKSQSAMAPMSHHKTMSRTTPRRVTHFGSSVGYLTSSAKSLSRKFCSDSAARR